MKVTEIPQELLDIIDVRAGKLHSRTGPVAQTLAEILTAYNAITSPLTRAAVLAALEHENFCRWPDHRGCCGVTVEDCTCNVSLNVRTLELHGWLQLREEE